jgi:hypothetical protein
MKKIASRFVALSSLVLCLGYLSLIGLPSKVQAESSMCGPICVGGNQKCFRVRESSGQCRITYCVQGTRCGGAGED